MTPKLYSSASLAARVFEANPDLLEESAYGDCVAARREMNRVLGLTLGIWCELVNLQHNAGCRPTAPGTQDPRSNGRLGLQSPALEACCRIGYRRLVMFDEDIIAEAGRRLYAAASPGSRVILFGSHARGEARADSDLDFLVVEPEVERAAAESVRLRRALRGLGLFADVMVVSESDVAAWRDVRGSLVRAALTDGRVLAA